MTSGKWVAIILVVGSFFFLLGAAVSVIGAAPPAGNPTSGAAAPSTSVLLEKGIYAEETAGDLDAAIKIYQDIVAQDKANRPLAAQAQYRLAMCYLKKGDKAKAETELRAVLASFSQDKEVGAKAHGQLAKLVPPVGAVPRVVLTMPATLANDVDASLGKITVTFDRPMMDKSWSWTGGADIYPPGTGAVSYDAARTTCTVSVKLQPGKVYWVGVNSPSYQGFKSADSKPAARYVILFATKSADGKPTPLPAELVKQAKEINAAAAQAGTAEAKPIDIQKVTALLQSGKALMAGVYTAVEKNDPDTALTLLRQEIAQARQTMALLAGTPAEPPLQTSILMLEKIETALVAKDNAQVKKLLETLGAMGQGLEDSIRDALAAQAQPAAQSSPTGDLRKVGALLEMIGLLSEQTGQAVRRGDFSAALTLWDQALAQEAAVLEAARGTPIEPIITSGAATGKAMRVALEKKDAGKFLTQLKALQSMGTSAVDSIEAQGIPIRNRNGDRRGNPGITSQPDGLKTWVENFFSENFRDVTARKTLKWGEAETTADGNLAIRYKYLATIWNKDQMVIEQRFTFTPYGKYLSHETLESRPATQPAPQP